MVTTELRYFLNNIITNIKVINDEEEIIFTFKNGDKLRMFHEYSCCERVYIESIDGDLNDLLDTPILMAEEVSNAPESPLNEYHESYKWTFYKFSTIKGYVTIRWYGRSNGCYSERVDFELNGIGEWCKGFPKDFYE